MCVYARVLGSLGLLFMLQWADMCDRAVLTHSCPSSLVLCVCVCCWMALVMVNERSERERRQMDCPEGQKTEGGRVRERETHTQKKKEEKNASQPLTHFALPAFFPSLFPHLLLCQPLWEDTWCYNAALKYRWHTAWWGTSGAQKGI